MIRIRLSNIYTQMWNKYGMNITGVLVTWSGSLIRVIGKSKLALFAGWMSQFAAPRTMLLVTSEFALPVLSCQIRSLKHRFDGF